MQESYEDEIIKGFPYPIIARFIKLLTPELYDPSLDRLQHILGTAEAISRYLGIIVLCECRELAESRPESIADFPLDLKQRLKTPSWGFWQEVIREGLKWLRYYQAPLLISELYPCWFDKRQKPSKTAQALDKILSIRNAFQHEKICKSPLLLCKETDPLLSQVLENLDFLLNYQLAFTSRIEAHKVRKQNTNFRHFIGNFIGESVSRRGRPCEYDFCMESKCTLLFKRNTQKYINLDPFLVFEEHAGNAADLFFFTGMKNPSNTAYTACNQGGVFEGNTSERADIINLELQNILDLL